ncbi:ATP-binding protein [Methylotenera sp.]|uniref:ATP-binding protein n=1 Tax=Methylotenera sp. TaxID=2051956 RepID=UPI002733D165|nr:ATP-binding protein [Methylotenera sp.]MDP3211572.1 ATP-binding protein [Methylotenera sp.]
MNYEERELLLDEHPIVTKKYLVVTPTIKRVYSLIRERVWMRRTGTFLFAMPRMGKSTCAEAVQDILEAEFPKIFTILFAAEKRKQSDSGLLIDILRADKLPVHSRTPYKDLFNHLITHIKVNISERGGAQFILLIDEMQLLSELDLNVLLVLHNRLELDKIKMTTIGFAQSDIQHLRSALHATKAQNLLARFLSEPIPFDGCANKKDLEEILNEYDNSLVYPDDTEFTYTRFFLPIAYSNGFRMNEYADPIWTALKRASKPLEEQSVPVQHLFRTIEYLLLAGRVKDGESYKISTRDIDEAIEASNLKEYCGILGSSGG